MSTRINAPVRRASDLEFNKTQAYLVNSVAWDLMIVLDGCGYDYFCSVNSFPGTVIPVRTSGNDAIEWLRDTFPNRFYNDIVYLSSTPYIASRYNKLQHGIDIVDKFFVIEDLWQWGINVSSQSVLPQTVINNIQKTESDFPSKRIVAHFDNVDPKLTLKLLDKVIKATDKVVLTSTCKNIAPWLEVE